MKLQPSIENFGVPSLGIEPVTFSSGGAEAMAMAIQTVGARNEIKFTEQGLSLHIYELYNVQNSIFGYLFIFS